MRCDCGWNFETGRKEGPHQNSRGNIAAADMARLIGTVLIILGLGVAGFFAFLFDTSVNAPSPSVEVTRKIDPALQIDRIQNLGLLQNRQSGISGGLELSILGGILLLYGKKTN